MNSRAALAETLQALGAFHMSIGDFETGRACIGAAIALRGSCDPEKAIEICAREVEGMGGRVRGPILKEAAQKVRAINPEALLQR